MWAKGQKKRPAPYEARDAAPESGDNAPSPVDGADVLFPFYRLDNVLRHGFGPKENGVAVAIVEQWGCHESGTNVGEAYVQPTGVGQLFK